MDARQDEMSNPFGMDEDCTNCPELVETRERIVHGYGDVGADFVVIGDQPSAAADETGVPFAGDQSLVWDVLDRVGLVDGDPGAAEPEPDEVFLTYVTRCRHPDRTATDEEVTACEAYRSSELRMINPEIIVPVGQRAIEALAFQYTTKSEDELDVTELHATTMRGRGFELVPMLDPADQTPEQTEAFVEHFADLLGTDYRQTKGRQGSLETGRGPDTDE
ncbi:uracil-DNA glycosylase [Halosimplex carlsbadense 2-9-1]|uniref:Uracil-DNA glycosylase n=1 Tax=Halosimplex carlsbadense 2-9-1 TaxID=797114 RepID=M0CJV1_9EURY|nr:uracil-DNA glycosylase [Halosimplex carlsbadense]ELZ23555.1 uracil-DNA glycosylase [Halosimplex carlsbadense 2-9-1]